MERDDIVYLTLLIFISAFGYLFRKITDKSLQKNVATALGFLIVFITSGKHILHPVFCLFVNWVIIKYFNKTRIHVISFGFSFLYLIFFRTTEYFGIPYPPAHTNIIQMILTLKLVGLAFELHDSMKAGVVGSPNHELECSMIARPSLIEMFHYSFCYIGVLTGPYFSYRAYWDFFNTPFASYAPCEKATLERAKYIPLYAVGFLLSNYFFPLSFAETSEFFLERSLIYRLWYVFPTFFAFRMRMYLGMRLSECGFTMSGLGAYPAITCPKPGKGPSKNHQVLVSIAANPKKVKEVEYSFEAIHNMEPWGAETEYTVRASMKHWNMTVQYWLANYVYKRFPVKAYRTPVTFLLSSIWHGMYAGHYMCLCSVPFYLPIEDMYTHNLKGSFQSPFMSKVSWLVAYTWRMFLMGYWSMAFVLLHVRPAFRFWYSIYFLPTLITILMYLFALVTFQKQSSTIKQKQT